MKTFVDLENSNRTWCHDAMLSAQRKRAGVKRVWSDFSSGSHVIEHEDDPDVLVALIKSRGRAVTVAGNGERMMVSLDGHEAAECTVSTATVGPGLDGEGPTMASPTATPPGGRPRSIARRPPETRSQAATGSKAGLSDRERGLRCGGGAGIRVLSREGYAQGLLLRATRVTQWAFRAVFRLPGGPR